MKLNLSVDTEEFKKKVEKLRKKLDLSLLEGELCEDVEKHLEELKIQEQKILSELVPYYRMYKTDITKTAVEIQPTESLGSFKFEGFIQSFKRINENLFVVSSLDKGVQFLFVDTSLQSEFDRAVEWSPAIKGIEEAIAFIHLMDNTLFMFGVMGSCYVVTSDTFEQMPDINLNIRVEKVKARDEFWGFGRCLTLKDNLLVMETEEDVLGVVEIKEKEGSYKLNFKQDIALSIPGWTAIKRISDEFLVVGTEEGKTIFLEYKNGKLSITGQLEVLNQSIRKIEVLQADDSSKIQIIVVGNKSQVKLLEKNDSWKLLDIEKDEFNGNLFDVYSQSGTAIILSEDGIVYILEENFGCWSLNQQFIFRDEFYTNVLPFAPSEYLLVDLEGNLDLLSLNRVSTPEDLWEIALYP